MRRQVTALDGKSAGMQARQSMDLDVKIRGACAATESFDSLLHARGLSHCCGLHGPTPSLRHVLHFRCRAINQQHRVVGVPDASRIHHAGSGLRKGAQRESMCSTAVIVASVHVSLMSALAALLSDRRLFAARARVLLLRCC
jgi:hypothetical protein